MNILPINIYSNNTTPSFGASAKTTVAVARKGGKAVQTAVTASIGAASAAAATGQVLVNKGSIKENPVIIGNEEFYIDKDGHLTKTAPQERKKGYYIVGKDDNSMIFKLPDGTLISADGTKPEPAMAIDVLKAEITSIQEKNLAVETKINQIDSYIEYRNNKVDSLVKELKSYYEFVKNENGEVDKYVDKIDKKSIQKIVDENISVSSMAVCVTGYVYDDLQYDLLRCSLSKDAVDFIKTKGKEYNCLSFENYIKESDVNPPENNNKSVPKNANAGTLLKRLDNEQQQLAKNEALLKSKEEMLQTTKEECGEKLDNINIWWIRKYEEEASNKLYDVIRECRNYASNNILSLFYGSAANLFGPYSDERKELVDLYYETNVATCKHRVRELLDKSIYTFVSGYSEMEKALERYNEGERSDFSFETWLINCHHEFKIRKEKAEECARRYREEERRNKVPERGTRAYDLMVFSNWLKNHPDGKGERPSATWNPPSDRYADDDVNHLYPLY